MRAKRTLLYCAATFLAVGSLAATSGFADSVTGNAATDGWTAGGNSLSSGTYVRGGGNYDYNTYSTSMTVTSGSTLATGTDWSVGDTVLGVGGVFTSAVPTGWVSSVGSINSLLSDTSGPKIQAKFGTTAGNFSVSIAAPPTALATGNSTGNGNGSFDSNSGSGGVQIRNPTSFTSVDWSTGGTLAPLGAGNLFIPTKPSDLTDHYIIVNDGSETGLTPDVARMIWTYDPTTGKPASWEILLDVSLLGPGTGDTIGLKPSAGASALMTVQDNDGAFTDALVSVPQLQAAAVPLPKSAWGGLALIGGLGMVAGSKRLRRQPA